MSDQQADRILVQVRRFCLLLGAALIYTSSKSTKNIQVEISRNLEMHIPRFMKFACTSQSGEQKRTDFEILCVYVLKIKRMFPFFSRSDNAKLQATLNFQ